MRTNDRSSRAGLPAAPLPALSQSDDIGRAGDPRRRCPLLLAFLLLLLLLLLSIWALAARAPGASASSIVFVRDGNVWLSSSDGSGQYEVTSEGGFSEPSQADDGTLVAVRGGEFVHMDRSGRLLSPPVGWPGAAHASATGSNELLGPYHARVSPDGTRIAYSFTQREYTCEVALPECAFQTVDYTTTSAVDSYTPTTPATSVSRDEDPAWIGNGRVLVSDPFDPQQINTWVPGHGNDGEQWWFDGYRDSSGAGVIEHEPALSPDQTRLVDAAAVEGQFSPFNHLYFYSTNGPASAGEPPYQNNDPTAPHPAEPTLRCIAAIGPVSSPVWSPDGAAIAFAQADGIHIAVVPGDLTQPGACARITGGLAIAGGSEPFWGPADASRPPPSAPPSHPAPTTPAPAPQPAANRHHRHRSCRTAHHRRARHCRRERRRH